MQQQEDDVLAPWGNFGELGPYLNALGFGGGVCMGDDGMQPQVNGEFAMSDGATSLEDWFSGTQHVLGLLEEDLSFIKTL